MYLLNTFELLIFRSEYFSTALSNASPSYRHEPSLSSHINSRSRYDMAPSFRSEEGQRTSPDVPDVSSIVASIEDEKYLTQDTINPAQLDASMPSSPPQSNIHPSSAEDINADP